MIKRILKSVLAACIFAVCVAGCINKLDGEYHPKISGKIGDEEYLLNSSSNHGIFYKRKESFSLYIKGNCQDVSKAFSLNFMVSAEGSLEKGKRYLLPTVENEKVWESFVVLSRWGDEVPDATSSDYTWHVKEGWVEFTFFEIFEAEGKCLVDGSFGFTLYNINDPARTVEVTSSKFRDFYIDYWDASDVM